MWLNYSVQNLFFTGRVDILGTPLMMYTLSILYQYGSFRVDYIYMAYCSKCRPPVHILLAYFYWSRRNASATSLPARPRNAQCIHTKTKTKTMSLLLTYCSCLTIIAVMNPLWKSSAHWWVLNSLTSFLILTGVAILFVTINSSFNASLASAWCFSWCHNAWYAQIYLHGCFENNQTCSTVKMFLDKHNLTVFLNI